MGENEESPVFPDPIPRGKRALFSGCQKMGASGIENPNPENGTDTQGFEGGAQRM